MRARPGRGLRCGRLMLEVFEAFGLTDLTVKIHGSPNPKNVIRAIMKGLSTQAITDEEMDARAHGTKYMNPNTIWMRHDDQDDRKY